MNSPRLKESLACDGLCRIIDDSQIFLGPELSIPLSNGLLFFFFFGPVCSFLIFLFRLGSGFGDYNCFFLFFLY